MLWPAIQKIIQGSLKWASELSQSTAYQSIVGYCSMETANSCNYDLMIDACWSMRKQSAEGNSVVYIFPRKEVDLDQNAVTSYSKDNSKKPKSASELSQSTAYQSIVGYCSMETANSCNYDLMIDACWSMRKQSAEGNSVVYIFPRKEVDLDQNAVTSYSKDNSKKPKSANELSQSVIDPFALS